jgi:hypothetical protein
MIRGSAIRGMKARMRLMTPAVSNMSAPLINVCLVTVVPSFFYYRMAIVSWLHAGLNMSYLHVYAEHVHNHAAIFLNWVQELRPVIAN